MPYRYVYVDEDELMRRQLNQERERRAYMADMLEDMHRTDPISFWELTMIVGFRPGMGDGDDGERGGYSETSSGRRQLGGGYPTEDDEPGMGGGQGMGGRQEQRRRYPGIAASYRGVTAGYPEEDHQERRGRPQPQPHQAAQQQQNLRNGASQRGSSSYEAPEEEVPRKRGRRSSRPFDPRALSQRPQEHDETRARLEAPTTRRNRPKAPSQHGRDVRSSQASRYRIHQQQQQEEEQEEEDSETMDNPPNPRSRGYYRYMSYRSPDPYVYIRQGSW